MSSEVFEKLRTRLYDVHDLQGAAGLMSWDQRTMMPPNGASVRSERLATVGRVAHDLFVADQTGELLDRLRDFEEGLPFESDEASLIRVARRVYEKERLIPSELAADIIRAGALGYAAWAEARATSDFSRLLPALARNIDLKRQVIAIQREAAQDGGEDYDVLLDDYEPGLTTAEVRSVFDELKAGTLALVAHVTERAGHVDDSPLHGTFDVARQRDFVLGIVRGFGFDEASWRLDPTLHPFASGIATSDIRITTRYLEDFLSSALFGTMHECGHGLYENGVSTALERTLLARGASMSWHESQSRLWENLVGRSRSFWSFCFPVLTRAFPGQFDGRSADQLYRAVNRMSPTLIRVEADELTYNLHIIFRFELEQVMLSGDLDLRDLPEAWNLKMREYLGIDVPDDADGVLQDVHWSGGSFGYFPTYALGNVVSLQLWERITNEIPELDEQCSRGEFHTLREWLRDNLHVHGRKFLPKELLHLVLGKETLDPQPLLRYLDGKVKDLYGAA